MFFAHAILVIFLPLCAAAFVMLRARTAMLTCIIGGWMFLPFTHITMKGLPDYDKFAAVGIGATLGILIFGLPRETRTRPHWLDIPIIVLCGIPMLTSLANGLGPYEGLSASLSFIFWFGLPYFLGRRVLGDLEGARLLTIAIFLGGLLYVPFCLFESRMAPVLHRNIYGFRPFEFVQTIRFGGYRPVVFMQHGLATAMWMASATLCGIVLYRQGYLKKLPWMFGSLSAIVLLLITTLMMRSLGALMLLVFGLALLTTCKFFRTKLPIILLACLPMLYIAVRAPGIWDGQQAVDVARAIDTSRARSLQYRLDSETVLVEKALQQPALGWGRFGRSRIKDQATGQDQAATDGLWINILGQNGLVGVMALYSLLVLPPLILAIRWRPAHFFSQSAAPVAALTMVLILSAIDYLFNAMVNPVSFMIPGVLVALLANRVQVGSPAKASQSNNQKREPTASYGKAAVPAMQSRSV